MAIELKKILFVCIENAGRSQMGEAFANKYGKYKFTVSSAGNKPASKERPQLGNRNNQQDYYYRSDHAVDYIVSIPFLPTEIQQRTPASRI